MNDRRARFLIPMACACALALSGCGDDDGTSPVAVDVEGSWRQVAGAYLLSPGYSLSAASTTLFIDLATVESTIHLRPFASGIVDCRPALYGFTADGLMVLATDPEDSGLYQVARPDENTLVLTNVQGQESIFTAAALPDSMRCLALDVIARHDLPVDLEYGTGLAYDGAFLWFTGRGQGSLIGVDPASGAVGASRDLLAKEAPLVHGAGGADLWRIERASFGVPSTAVRVGSDETILDTVDTVELGAPLEVECLAVDPDDGTLLLHGTVRMLGSVFLRVDADAEPDRLLADVESQVHADAVGWMDKRLLAVGGYPQRLLELDPVALRATRTYEELDPDLEALGLAAAGDRLFLLARPARSSQAVILEVAP